MALVHSQGLLWTIPGRSPRKEPIIEGKEQLEVIVFWGESLLSVHHLYPPRAFVIGDGSAPCDFVVPEELKVGAQRPICHPESPRSVSFGPLHFRCTLTERDATRFPSSDWDRDTFAYFGASVASAVAMVVALAAFAPPLGVTDEEELDRDRLQTMLQFLHTQAERQQLARSEEEASSRSPSAASEGSEGTPGAMGKPNSAVPNRPFASRAPAAARDTTTSRAAALDEARSFGMIAMLGEPSHPGALWARESALASLDRDLHGSLFSRELGESGGDSGLGLSGPGQGSGGPGAGIAVGSVGTCQTLGGCTGGHDGFGRDSALGLSTHQATAPSVRSSGGPDVSGVLPAELVQRVVRQNFGRFRNCYEQGLRRNPSLSGRVTARFVIDRAGAVTLAQNGGSDLPDSAVVSCVLSAFYGLSFPAPDNGTVRVSYPILFSVG
jgi:hypothetical protein